MIDSMNRESRELIKTLVSLTYFMRGAISYDEFMWRTYAEREIIKDFLDSRFETESKNPHPVY